jgi:hypothetical protein
MSVVLITGQVIGLDNNMRQYFFGEEGSTLWIRDELREELDNYTHRDEEAVTEIFRSHGMDISLIIHAVEKHRDTLYTPWFWRFIMLIIIHIPGAIFKRMGL